ncbi:hypothetical protein AB0395_24760 [Streptosporangium sp. NPDC051023]|uniref:hypothetical protein n=1 Tax=Streptosporangium sp. NPDC051023 TaxID=3155410 RepID=UPI00344C4937
MIRRLSRSPGRHRAGQPRTSVHRRLWDGPARAEVKCLERSRPDWAVLYSLGRRRFYAIATWPTPEPVIVEDDTAAGLEGQMREKETALTWQSLLVSTSSPSPATPSSLSSAGYGGIAALGRAALPQQAFAPQHPYRRTA